MLMQPEPKLRSRTDLSDGQVLKLCDQIRETGFALHKYLGPGFREKVYEREMTNRLKKAGLEVVAQPRVEVFDEDGTLLTEDQLDLVVEDVLIIELKAAKAVHDDHVSQLLGYLRATSFRHGLLMNFGAAKFQIKKYVF